jgi:ABC-type uncharacterized transport system substrate-binding protein
MPEDEPRIEEITPPAISKRPEIPVVPPDPPPEPPPPPAVVEPPALAVVLANRSAAYEDVALALDRHFDDNLVFDLSDRSQPAEAAFAGINDGDTDAVVAIGLRAAQAAVALAKVPVVFAQVFNFQDYGLVTDNSRGVAAMPPVEAQFAAWKELDPMLSRVGMILGEGHEDLVESAEIAADRHALQLTVRIARSDQETLYFFRRMITDIDGFLLVPDNRVLSRRALEEMLDEANRRNIAVAVPNDALLSMGAAVSFTSSAQDIADRIAAVVRSIAGGGVGDVRPITPLTEIRVRTNDAVMQKRMVARDGARSADGGSP